MFFSFQHGDLIHTGNSSFALLQGHFLDFYSYNKTLSETCSYLISTYIVFAIWNLPVLLFCNVDLNILEPGLLVFWYKLFTSILFFLASLIIYKICKLIGLNKIHSKLVVILWLSCPIALFSQFIFGQYDIITLILTLWGIYFLLQKKKMRFTILFSIAITFKYFPVLIFFPLLFLLEKNLFKIIKYTIVLFIPVILEIIIFINSVAFRENVMNFGVIERIYNVGIAIDGNNLFLNLFFLFWIFICGYTYFKKFENTSLFYYWVIYLPLLIFSVLFSFIFWHPQWLIILTPFLVITTMLQKRIEFFWFSEFLMMFFLVGFIVNNWANNVDAFLLNNGIGGYFKQIDHNNILMQSFFIPNKPTLYFTFFIGTLLFTTFLKFPYNKSKINFQPENKISIIKYWNLVRLRFLGGILVFVIPAFLCYFLPEREVIKGHLLNFMQQIF